MLMDDAEVEVPIFWPPGANSWPLGKDLDAGKGWRHKKRVSEDEMVWWHHQFNLTWVWASSRRWLGTRRPNMLQSMGSQRCGHDLLTEQQQHGWEYCYRGLGIYLRVSTSLVEKNMRIDTLKKTKIVFPYGGHTSSGVAQLSAKRYFMVSDFTG